MIKISRATSESVSSILSSMRALEELYRISLNGQSDADNIGNDLRHDLELNELSYHERAKIATLMQTRCANDGCTKTILSS